MAPVAAQSENAAELLQKLSLGYQPKNIEVQDNKFGSLGSNTKVNGYAKPYERATSTPPIQDFTTMSTYYAPQGYPSAACYYGGYDRSANEWSDYRYMNGNMADMKSGLQQQNLNSGAGQNVGYMGKLQAHNQFYGNYGNTYGPGSRYPSNYYNNLKNSWYYSCNPTGVRNMPKNHGNGLFRYGYQQNKDGFNELSKGPRSEGGLKNQVAPGCVNSAAKIEGLPLNVTSRKEDDNTPSTPAKEQYNKEGFPEDYSDAKFFVIKSYSEDDIHKSIKYGVWSSTPNGNKKLDAAYHEAQAKPSACPVFLLFSVNSSGQFVGLAEMVGSVDFDKTMNCWQQDKWIGCFPVKWHIVKDVPNSLLKHIRLESNENKPVTNSRDTQEVNLEQGNLVLRIFKFHVSNTCILDDFCFYESRETAMQEKKTKKQHYQK